MAGLIATIPRGLVLDREDIRRLVLSRFSASRMCADYLAAYRRLTEWRATSWAVPDISLSLRGS
jgi:hypothetical protein